MYPEIHNDKNHEDEKYLTKYDITFLEGMAANGILGEEPADVDCKGDV